MGQPPAASTALPAPADVSRLQRELQRRLPGVMLRDSHRLRRRLDGARRQPAAARLATLTSIEQALAEAEARVAARRSAVPAITYPDLPVSARREDLLKVLSENQVVVVAGETGSGKTTQLPKMCLELGRGVLGAIGHTQPRRIAARAVAERLAEETRTTLGDAVGYQVRFTEKAGEDTLVRVMTDGILLAQLRGDRMLRQYDTLVIDEAHERSLTIDFLLGYLKQLLPRRPDLKVIVTSATIDPQRFADHFGGAPVVEVSGRTYPVEVRYRPLVVAETDAPGRDGGAGDDDDADDPGAEKPETDRDPITGITDALVELLDEPDGDVLVFLSGEREIRDTEEALSGFAQHHPRLRHAQILPLYGRLSAAEQHKVFAPHPGRRIVLATNVAETSLTVPGIRYVIDTGTARISRYSLRSKVQRLPIEPVSQASANQRAGRCGRVADGVCIRLYSEQDYLARPRFTDPEILRTNLASVVLQMASLDLGDVERFPFVDAPDARAVRDAVALLHELGAVERDGGPGAAVRLTDVGRSLARLPVDPRLGRMIVDGDRNGCLLEVLVIVAGLSIQDPRERPLEHREQADTLHRRFAAPLGAAGDAAAERGEASDFLAWLNLWNHLQEQQAARSGNQFRRMCREEFLNYLRVREWQDLYAQLRQAVRDLGLNVSTPRRGETPPAPDPRAVHRAVLAGLLTHVGLRDPEKRDYVGARGARFSLTPGSALFRSQPRWVMAAELVETTRLWARTAARVEPEWVEALAGHLVKRTYSEPRWDRARGAVLAQEKVTLYGVPLVASRTVGYGSVDPPLARELFLRHALVEGDWDTTHRFFETNRKRLEEVRALEDRARRRDLLVDDETLFAFYDERVGAEVVSARHFDSWWKRARRDTPDLLTLPRSLLMSGPGEGVARADYPDEWPQGDLRLRLTYQFEPGTDADGVTVHVPLPVLNRLRDNGFDWQIPGLREELVTAMIRSLPKDLRRSFVPAPDHARAVLADLPPGLPPADAAPFGTVLAQALTRRTGTVLPPDRWDWARVPDHLKVTFRVVGDRGRIAGEGKDLALLRAELATRVRATIASAAGDLERSGLRDWSFGALPETFETTQGGLRMQGYPALVEEGDAVAVRVLGTAEQARRATWRGTRRLLLLSIPSPTKQVLGRLDNETKLSLAHHPYPNATAMFDDCVTAAVDSLMARAGGPVREREAFEALRREVRAGLPGVVTEIVLALGRILGAAHDCDVRLTRLASSAGAPRIADSLDDARRHLQSLVHPGLVTELGRDRLGDAVRWLRGLQARLDRLASDPRREREWLAAVHRVELAWQEARARRPGVVELDDVRWRIEELRVGLFAQPMRTAYPVSEQRVLRAIEAAAGG